MILIFLEGKPTASGTTSSAGSANTSAAAPSTGPFATKAKVDADDATVLSN